MFPDEFEILKKSGIQPQTAPTLAHLNLQDNIDKWWKANRKWVLISHNSDGKHHRK